MIFDFFKVVLLLEGGNTLLVFFPRVKTRELSFISVEIYKSAVKKDKNLLVS